ncbi:MAG: ribonuclease HI [Bacteroidota bacterium]
MSDAVIIYTDGSARGNPGPGGYGAILLFGDHRKELAQGFRRTTNNRMELLAVIEALRALKRSALRVTIYSDSQYVVKAIEEKWLDKWIRTDFKGGKKNRDLWTDYYMLSQKHQIRFQWVKGHADNPYNNRCDELATQAADKPSRELLIDEGYEAGINEC